MNERFCEQKPRLSHIDTEYKTLLLHHVKKKEKRKFTLLDADNTCFMRSMHL